MLYEREFGSVDQLIDEALNRQNEQRWNMWDSVSGRNEFYGCSGRAEAEQLAKFGWKEGREAVERIKARIERQMGRHGRTFVCQWDVTGAVVDVGAYVSGEPECMINFEEVETEKLEFVDVHFSSAVSGSVGQEEMTLQGAAVCALVDALENSGRRVRVRWERSSSALGRNGAPTISLSVVLKDYGDALDLDRLAFFTTSACARRPLAWSIYTLAPEAVREHCGLHKGVGGPHTWPVNDPKYLGADVHVSAMVGGTETAAARWVLAKLEELGVEVKREE